MTPTEREMVADMVHVALSELEVFAKGTNLGVSRNATIAICRMLDRAPEVWKEMIAKKLDALEVHGFVQTPQQYRPLVRRALGPPRDEPKGYVL